MSTLLIKNAHIVTMDDHQREIPEGGLFIRRGLIQEVGPMSELPTTADEVLDLKGHIVLPGLVNTHHHFYQTLTRAVPAAQDTNLFNWLKTLYPIWARINPKIFLHQLKLPWRNLLYLDVPPPQTISIFSRTDPDSTTKLPPRRRSDSACRLRAAPCPLALHKADFRLIPL